MDLKEVDKLFDNEYFSINKKLNLFTGLWPYNPGIIKYIQRTIVVVFLGAVSLPHVNGIRIWCGKDVGLCLENVAGVSFALGVFLKYIVTFKNQHKLSEVYIQVTEYWKIITDPIEKEIIIQYAKLARFKSLGYIVIMSSSGVCFSQMGMIPVVLDYIMPLNESRPKLLPVQGEFFVDPFKYYYYIYFIYCGLSVVSLSVLLSTDTTYTAVVHQNLAIFNVIKHRLQKATKLSRTDKDVAYETIVSAVRLHQDSLRLIDLIETTYDVSFLILISICITFLSCAAITIMEREGQLLETIRLVMLLCGVVVHLFFLSWPGQLVIIESSDLFLYTYFNEWYHISEKAKTLLKIMMVRCIKPCCLTAGGLYVMSFENFGSIIKSTVSYITVLASFRA